MTNTDRHQFFNSPAFPALQLMNSSKKTSVFSPPYSIHILFHIETTLWCREIKIQGKEGWAGETKMFLSDRFLAIKKYKNISQQIESGGKNSHSHV